MITTDDKVTRLLRYRSAVRRMKAMGLSRVYSDNIADATGVSALQVRKDFCEEGVRGVRRGGYLVDSVLARLEEVLGKDTTCVFVLVGVGSLGTALLKYDAFAHYGIKIVAAFDVDPAKLDARAPIPVLPVKDLTNYCRTHHIRYAIITVPEGAAIEVYEALVAGGVKGILNFAPVRLRSAGGVIVNNVNLVYEIEQLVYFVKHARSKR
ncbi:MAG: redox-sensing transcriptional repressor Rex [bacterium]|nr:redox-sensing transcriptional repressor Rex [bacterium]